MANAALLDQPTLLRHNHVVASLKSDGRAHAIVVSQEENGKQSLVDIFSVSQIARQLGVQIQTYEMARTFAEIEAVIAGV